MNCADSTAADFARMIKKEGQPVQISVKELAASVHAAPVAPVTVLTYGILRTVDVRASANVPALSAARFSVRFADDGDLFGAQADAIRSASGTDDALSIQWSLTGGAVTEQAQSASLVAVVKAYRSEGTLIGHEWALGGVS